MRSRILLLALPVSFWMGCFSTPETVPPRVDAATRAMEAGAREEARGCLESALGHYEVVLRQAALGGLIPLSVEARLAAARVAAAQGDKQSASHLLWRALLDAKVQAREDLRVRALVQQAYLEGLDGEAAGKSLNDALVTCCTHAPDECGAVLNALGQQARRRGERGLARQSFTEALNANRTAERFTAEADNRMNLGLLDEEAGQFDAAQKQYEAAFQLDRRTGNSAGVAGALEGLMRVAAAKGDVPTALSQGLSALDVWEALGRLDQAMRLASALIKQPLPAQEAAALTKKIGDWKTQTPIHSCD